MPVLLHPECCHQPAIRSLLVLDQAPDGEIVLKQCTNCLTFWRVTTQDRMGMDGLADQLIETFEAVTPETGHDLLYGRTW